MSEKAKNLLKWLVACLIGCAAVWISTDIIEFKIGSLLLCLGTTIIRAAFVLGERSGDEVFDVDGFESEQKLMSSEEIETGRSPLNPYTGELGLTDHIDISGNTW